MMKFVITRRRLAPGGMYIVLQHKECNGEASIFVPNDSDLTGSWPVGCNKCLQRTAFIFGDPRLGRRLLDLLKKPQPRDKFDSASDPLDN